MAHPGNAAESLAEDHDRSAGSISGPVGERVALLLAMRGHLEIVHHIPGRLRVRASAGLLDLARRWRGPTIPIDEAVGIIDGIHAARVNPMAASAVIEYDPLRVAPNAWQRLLEGDDAEALGILKAHVPGLDREGLERTPGNDNTATSKEDD
jgi:hypothetical protein